MSIRTFQSLIAIYRRSSFVYHYWGCTSINRPLSYPFRSLGWRYFTKIFYISKFDVGFKSTILLFNVLICLSIKISNLWTGFAIFCLLIGHKDISSQCQTRDGCRAFENFYFHKFKPKICTIQFNCFFLQGRCLYVFSIVMHMIRKVFSTYYIMFYTHYK